MFSENYSSFNRYNTVLKATIFARAQIKIPAAHIFSLNALLDPMQRKKKRNELVPQVRCVSDLLTGVAVNDVWSPKPNRTIQNLCQ